VDALVLRDRDADGNPANGLEERLYAQQDANWNITALVNPSAHVVERYDYDPYGQATILSPTWAVLGTSAYVWVYLHQGGRYDSSTGLSNFRGRDYTPSLGRWQQQDPLGFKAGEANLYRYVGNNPGNFTDPYGLQTYRKYGGGEVEKTLAFLWIGVERSKTAAALAERAVLATRRHFPKSNLHNDLADAWRHCLWSCLMRQNSLLKPFLNRPDAPPDLRWEYDPAWLAGLFHEYQGEVDKQPQIEFAMDMHNNNVGLQLGMEKGDCAAACDRALREGKLVCIIAGPDSSLRLTKPATYYVAPPRARNLSDAERFSTIRKQKVVTDLSGLPRVVPGR
jgi:RHS repeat-associated protein